MEQLITVLMVFGATVVSLAFALVALKGVSGTCSSACESTRARCDFCPSGRAADDELEEAG